VRPHENGTADSHFTRGNGNQDLNTRNPGTLITQFKTTISKSPSVLTSLMSTPDAGSSHSKVFAARQ